MLKAADVNGDGRIDYTEFIAAAFQKDLLLSTENLRAAFNMIDVNGDGTISKDELKQVFGDVHAGRQGGDRVWDEIMSEVNESRDGKISFEEFEAAMKIVIRHHTTFTQSQD